MTRIAAPAVMVAGALALGACTGTSPEEPSTTSSTASLAELGPTPRAADLTYDQGDSSSAPSLVDVWAQPQADGQPVVVMFHGGVGNRDKRSLSGLARHVAARGAVVFVPTLRPAIPAEPVSPLPADKTPPTSGTAVCLSGGGYRAMLF